MIQARSPEKIPLHNPLLQAERDFLSMTNGRGFDDSVTLNDHNYRVAGGKVYPDLSVYASLIGGALSANLVATIDPKQILKPLYTGRVLQPNAKQQRIITKLKGNTGLHDFSCMPDPGYYYDEADPSLTAGQTLMSTGAFSRAIDLSKTASVGRNANSVPSNMLAARVNNDYLHDVIAAGGPRVSAAAKRMASSLIVQSRSIQASAMDDRTKWIAGKVELNSLATALVAAFYETLADTELDAGLDTSFLKEYSDQLFEDCLLYIGYGVKDSVGDVDNKNLPFTEVQITSPDALKETINDSAFDRQLLPVPGVQPIAIMTFSTVAFKSSKLLAFNQDGSACNIKGFRLDTEQASFDDKLLAVYIGNDGKLYGNLGVDLEEKAAKVGAENEFQQLRAEAITKLFDLTVPLEDEHVFTNTPGRRVEPREFPGNGDQYWSKLKIRRQRVRPISSIEDEENKELGQKVVRFREVVYHYRTLPEGYRASEYAAQNHRDAMLSNGYFEEAEAGIPEGKTFVKKHSFGDESTRGDYLGTRLTRE
jgi:hypothetical protein